MQLSDKAAGLLRELLSSESWSLRRGADLERWREFGRQLFLDGARHFDDEVIRRAIHEELGEGITICGRLRDEVELRIRLAAAVFDFSWRESQLHIAGADARPDDAGRLHRSRRGLSERRRRLSGPAVALRQ